MKPLLRTLAAALLAGAALTVFTPRPLVFAAQGLQAGAEAEARVTQLSVRVSGAASDAGVIWVGLYADRQVYDAGDELASADLAIYRGEAGTVFEYLAPGDYAVLAFHDADADGDFSRNFIGVPQERYGFSNNPRPRFRAARWEEAVFTVPAEAESEIDVTLFGAGR